MTDALAEAPAAPAAADRYGEVSQFAQVHLHRGRVHAALGARRAARSDLAHSLRLHASASGTGRHGELAEAALAALETADAEPAGDA